MKKIWLTFAGSLFFAMAVVAQERSDTTSTQTNDPSTDYRRSETQPMDQESGTQAETSTIQGKSATQGQSESQNWSDQDRETVSRENLPSGLVETLKSEQYRGWENATIYRNKVLDQYMLVIQDNGTTRTFYFDNEGQALDNTSPDDQSSASYRTQSGTTGTTDDATDKSVDMTNETTGGDPTTAEQAYPSGTGSERAQGYPGTGTQGDSGVTGSRTETSQENPNNANATGATSTSSGTTTPSGTSGTTLGTEQPSVSWRPEDRVVILTDDIPSSLRVTLEDEKYKGWENSTIYRNRQTDEYMIEIRDGSSSRIYYFDKDGKAIEVAESDDN